MRRIWCVLKTCRYSDQRAALLQARMNQQDGKGAHKELSCLNTLCKTSPLGFFALLPCLAFPVPICLQRHHCHKDDESRWNSLTESPCSHTQDACWFRWVVSLSFIIFVAQRVMAPTVALASSSLDGNSFASSRMDRIDTFLSSRVRTDFGDPLLFASGLWYMSWCQVMILYEAAAGNC
jgi:hypothetical protein